MYFCKTIILQIRLESLSRMWVLEKEQSRNILERRRMELDHPDTQWDSPDSNANHIGARWDMAQHEHRGKGLLVPPTYSCCLSSAPLPAP